MSDHNETQEKTGENQEIRRNPDGTFQKGVSGNPKGKPKGVKHFTTKVRNAIEKMTEENGVDMEDQMAQKVVDMFMKGDTRIIKMFWEYTDGKPVATNININQDDEEAKKALDVLKSLLDHGSSQDNTSVLQDGGQTADNKSEV